MNKIIKTIMDGGKRAAMYTSMMVCTIALISLYSCSADGEYDEPWVNKEHRTRAGNPESGLWNLEAGHLTKMVEDKRVSVNYYIKWDDFSSAHNFLYAEFVFARTQVIRHDSTVCVNYPAIFPMYGGRPNLWMNIGLHYSYYDADSLRRINVDYQDEMVQVPLSYFYQIP